MNRILETYLVALTMATIPGVVFAQSGVPVTAGSQRSAACHEQCGRGAERG